MVTYFGPTKLTEEEKEQRRKASRKKYYEKNRERCKEMTAKWLKEHEDKRKAYQKKYAEKNKEKIRAYFKEYYYKNRDNMISRSIERHKENKDRAETDNQCKSRGQMTLGEFIDKLEKRIKKYPEATSIGLDWGDANITGFCSYRGDYRHLAMCYSGEYGKGYSSKELLEELKKCIGKTFTGWKGGEFVMNRDTYLYIANDGCTGGTYPVDIVGCDSLLQIRTETEKDTFYEVLDE